MSRVFAWACAAALLFAMIGDWTARPIGPQNITLISASLADDSGPDFATAHSRWRSAFLLMAGALTLNELRKSRLQ